MVRLTGIDEVEVSVEVRFVSFPLVQSRVSDESVLFVVMSVLACSSTSCVAFRALLTEVM